MTRFNASMLLVAAALTAGAMPAVAAIPGAAQTSTRMVRAGDLDLRSPAGQASLQARIRRAAAAVCGPAEAFPSLGYRDYATCRDQAEAQAMARARVLIARATTQAPCLGQ